MSGADVLRTIKDAEADAAATLAKAQSDANNITKARGRRRELLAKVELKHKRTHNKWLMMLEFAAQKEANKVSKRRQSHQSIHGDGESNRSTAVDIVLDAFRA